MKLLVKAALQLSRFLPWVLFALVCVFSPFVLAKSSSTGIINFVTPETGMHRISYEELGEQGVDLSGFEHRKFSLRSDGQQVGIRTKGQNKSQGRSKFFGPGGYIEFYSETLISRYTDKRVITLHYGAPRKQIRSVKNRLDKTQSTSENYIQSTQFEQNYQFDYLADSGDDPWHFGQTFIYKTGDTEGPSIDFELPGLVGATATIEVEVYGLRDTLIATNDHHIVANVNGAEVGNEQFDGFSLHTMRIENVPVSDTGNRFTLYGRSIADVPFDVIGLNKLTVHYPRGIGVNGDYLEGWITHKQVKASGLSGRNSSVYRRNHNGSVVKIKGVKKQSKAAEFSTGGVAGQYIVVGPQGFKKPAIRLINDDKDISSESAEYLIITHDAFKGAELSELVALRNEYAVKVVDVEQIYGQFGNHQPNALAIHDYIKFAATNLGTRFVVLIGSDTYDYKNHISESISFIPTNYRPTLGGSLDVQQTPTDALYGDIDGDSVPDIPVGRLSVRTKAELGLVVGKLKQYEDRTGYAGSILFAADKEDAGNSVSFTNDVTAMMDVMPEQWSSSISEQYLALPDVDGDQVAHDKTIAAINNGVLVTAYIGHSSQQVWGRTSPAMLTASEIPALANTGRPTLITQWGCWNAFFVDPGGNSMADVFLTSGTNGAATVLGASTLTTASGERKFGIELNKRMFAANITIGEAVIAAKKAFAARSPGNSGIILGYQIIGDPALKINPQ